MVSSAIRDLLVSDIPLVQDVVECSSEHLDEQISTVNVERSGHLLHLLLNCLFATAVKVWEVHAQHNENWVKSFHEFCDEGYHAVIDRIASQPI